MINWWWFCPVAQSWKVSSSKWGVILWYWRGSRCTGAHNHTNNGWWFWPGAGSRKFSSPKSVIFLPYVRGSGWKASFSPSFSISMLCLHRCPNCARYTGAHNQAPSRIIGDDTDLAHSHRRFHPRRVASFSSTGEEAALRWVFFSTSCALTVLGAWQLFKTVIQE